MKDYKYGHGKSRKTVSLTRATYDDVGDFFRQLWGDWAGWAHTVLFAADLPQFATVQEQNVIKVEDEGKKRETDILVEMDDAKRVKHE